MTTIHKAAGYMIQDNHGTAIYGIGQTVDEAWAEVVAGVRTFFNSYGDDISANEAYETQFKKFGATAELIAAVRERGGDIAWDVTYGVAHLPEDEDYGDEADLISIEMADLDRNLIADMDAPAAEWTAWEHVMVRSDGLVDSNRCLHILHHAQAQRAGIVLVGSGSSGITVWTDAATPGEALRRYLADDLAN